MYLSRSQNHKITQNNKFSERRPIQQEPNTGNNDVRIDLRDITLHNIEALKNVNQVVLSTTYPDDFYQDMLYAGELAKLAFYNDIVAGAICCYTEISKTPSGETSQKLHIMTLGCLTPYRRLGIVDNAKQ